MLFNSLQFLLFFPLVTILYWLLPHRFRNAMLLIASYYFYMSWNPTYGLLILFSTAVTWGSALILHKQLVQTESSRTRAKLVLFLCLFVNLLILFVFKYANWGIDTINYLSESTRWRLKLPNLDLLLPVGISFYTFQAIGYTIDVYRRQIEPEKNFFTYALFVSFFPQLVAGPIERAKNLLPQFHYKHTFDSNKFWQGLQMMVWGYFMKLCIAERVAPYVDAVYNNLDHHNGTSILLASFFFTFQIYGDFCGYSLIAIGVAKALNFDLMLNFNRPYFATNIQFFWRRWHISLSTWFMDYVYIPLGGSRCKMTRHLLNLFITFLVSGIWHGANWTFVIWGMYHGGLIVIHTLIRKLKNKDSLVRVPQFISVIITFILALIGWVIFRANNISDALVVYKKMLFEHGSLFGGDTLPKTLLGLVLIVFLFFSEAFVEYKPELYNRLSNKYPVLKMGFVIILILMLGEFVEGQFIYFQF